MKDKHGIEIKEGDILRYQETEDPADDYGKSLDEVVLIEGRLYGVQRVGLPRWTMLNNTSPIDLCYYAAYPHNQMDCAEIVGNVVETPERLTPEYAHRTFPLPSHQLKSIYHQAMEDKITLEGNCDEGIFSYYYGEWHLNSNALQIFLDQNKTKRIKLTIEVLEEDA